MEKHQGAVVSNNHESSSSSTVAAVVEESVIMVRSNSSKQTDESISIDENKKAKGVLDCNLVGKEEFIDVKLDDDDSREMVCRICHLSCDQSPERERGVTGVDDDVKMKESSLVQLGCGCKDELGVAHSHCAEAWFKLKGNRICEICGEGARNIRGIIQEHTVVEWNDRGSYESYSPESHGGWWRAQPCCNFLMACLIVAFVLPWFFRVKIV